MNLPIRFGASLVAWMFVVAVFAPGAALAQSADTVSGTVVDASGGAVMGAQVLLKDNSGTFLKQMLTDKEGRFAFAGLASGRYQIEVKKDLFQTAHLAVEVAAGRPFQPVRIPLVIAANNEEITVGAPKVDERPVGQIVTSIQESVIENSTGFSVGETLPYSPGVTLVQGNGPRDVVLSVRGSNIRSTFGIRGVQLFDDGFIVTQPDGLSRSDLNDPHAYGQIDVERGPSSSLYGNYAMEGAINFHTRRPEDVGGLEVGVDGGSFAYRNAYVTYGHKDQNFEVLAFGSAVTGNGFTDHTSFQTYTANVLGTFTPSSDNKFTFKFINNEMYPNLAIRLSLNQFALNPYQNNCALLAATGCGSVSVFVNGATGTKVSLSADQAGLQRHDRRTIMGVRWEHLLNARTTWRTQVMFDNKDIKQPTGATSAVGNTPAFNVLSDVTQSGTLAGKPAVHFFGLSANFENTNSLTYNIMPGGNATLGVLTATTYGHAANIGMRAREELSLFPKSTLTASLGLEHSELYGLNSVYTYSATAAPVIAPIEALRKFTNAAPELTFTYQATNSVRLQSRAGTAYGTPQSSNLFVTPAGVSGNNTQLKSESNLGIDTGMDITTSFLSFGLAGYYEWFRNELLTQSPGVNLLSYTFNAPRSIHKGFEATTDSQVLGSVLPGLRFRASYTYMDQLYNQYVEQLSAGTFTQAFNRAGNKIPGIAPNNLAVRLGYDQLTGEAAGFGAHIEYLFRDRTWMDNADLAQAPGYGETNISFHFNGLKGVGFLKGYHLLFEVRNVTNRVWVASASNLSDSLSSTTGAENGLSVLSTSGSIYAGSPRSFVVSLRGVF